MAGSARRIVVQFLGEDKSLGKTAKDVEGKTHRMGAGIAKVGKAAAAGLAVAGVGAVLFGKQVLDSASMAQQSLGATETVFGKFADKVKMYSIGAANQVGLSANAYRENANLIGSLFKNQGVALDELAGKTDDMIDLGADLAATFGGTTKEAVEALGSAFKGEFDPMERYGVSLKQSTVNAEAMKVAHVKSQAAFDKLSTAQQTAAKQQATTNIIMKQSKDSAGAFARESDTLAGAQQRLGAKFENLKATLGEKLLPIATKVVGWVTDMIDKFNTGGQAGERFKGVFAAIGNVIRPIGEWIGNDLVPFIKDLGHRLNDAMGGTTGFKKAMSDLKPILVVVKWALGLLWEGFKWANKQILPVIVTNFRLFAQAISAVGKLAVWLWNNAFAPTIRFILRGVGWVIEKFADMLDALGNVPGFEWAQRAADKLHNAGRAAAYFAQSIKDIPSSKEVKIKVRYSDNSGIGGADKGSYGPRVKLPAHARGTTNAPGGWSWLNEQGPELVKMRGGAQVVPARKSAAALGGSTVIINIHGVLDKQGAGREVRKVLLDLKRTVGPLGLA